MARDKTAPPTSTCKKSILQRYRDSKRGLDKPAISDEDLVKYTGMTRAQINEWGKSRRNVGGNQDAGEITVGVSSGLGLSGITAGDG